MYPLRVHDNCGFMSARKQIEKSKLIALFNLILIHSTDAFRLGKNDTV